MTISRLTLWGLELTEGGADGGSLKCMAREATTGCSVLTIGGDRVIVAGDLPLLPPKVDVKPMFFGCFPDPYLEKLRFGEFELLDLLL